MGGIQRALRQRSNCRPVNVYRSLGLGAVADLSGKVEHVSVLCPGMVRTGIDDSERNWPDRFCSIPKARYDEMSHMFETMLRSLIEGGVEPAEVAQQVFSAVPDERFWLLPNAEGLGPAIKEVAASALEGRTPPIVQVAESSCQAP